MEDVMNQKIDPKLMATLEKIRDTSELYLMMSACTKAPYVVCDEETCDDQVLLFFSQEEAQEKGKQLMARQIPVGIAKLEKQSLLFFCTSLYTLGVNAMLIHDGADSQRIQLEELVKRRDPSTLGEGKVWVENPELHLTALYYMQELRRFEKPQITPEMMELQEEVAAHFSKGKYLVALPLEEKGIPLVRLKNGDVFQPIFTDAMEYEKFNREKKFRAVVVEAEKLAQILPAEAQGVILNPMGINMPLNVKRPQGQNPAGAAAAPNNAAGNETK